MLIAQRRRGRCIVPLKKWQQKASDLQLTLIKVWRADHHCSRYSRQSLIRTLEQLINSRSKDYIREAALDWGLLVANLQQLGVSPETAEEEFFFVRSFLEKRVLGGNEEPLPDYTPASHPTTISEKVEALQQTTRLLSIQDENIESAPASSSKTSPPPYTFDSDTDEDLDKEFLEYIRSAVKQESIRRFLTQQQTPSLVPQPYSWLSQDLQARLSDVKYLVPLNEDCFTIMAYETIPQCTKEIARLVNILNVSFGHKPQTAMAKVVQEASASLNVLSTATAKFILLQDQNSGHAKFSDLDSFDFEFGTASVSGKHQMYEFPTREFDYARKSCYNLLTYIMGMLQVFSDIFQGRAYITRPSSELKYLWKDKKMATRTAWIEKQLTIWEKVEDAVLYCRTLRALHPTLRDQAIKVLNDWREAETILSGRSGDDIVTLTVGAVSDLPKPTLGSLSTSVRVVFYGPNHNGGALRLFEFKTDTSKSQSPVWNKSFVLAVASGSRFVDLELYDRIAGIDKYLGRRRLEFSFIPGVEATLANRSLMCAFDGMCGILSSIPCDAKFYQKSWSLQ
jgi:hypothetical protein